MAAFVLDVSYAQLAVFDSSIVSPFNDWTQAHVDQGFAWRPGSVSFGTLDTSGPLRLEVFRSRELVESASHSQRIIRVPFAVPEHGKLEVGSIGSSAILEVPCGQYEMTFEHGIDAAGQMWANLYFRACQDETPPRILRADKDLRPPEPLLMTAEPA